MRVQPLHTGDGRDLSAHDRHNLYAAGGAGKPCAAERQSSEPCGEAGARPLRALLPKGMDTGDLLLLAIVLLLLIDGEEDDTLSILLTLAAFILM